MPEFVDAAPELARLIKPYLEEYIADETISALRVVRPTIDGHIAIARPPELEALAPYGITVQSGLPGSVLRVAIAGPVVDPSWSWIPGRAVLLGLEGVLTQQQPAGLRQCVVVGMATAATSIVVRIAHPIWLAD